MPYPVFLNLKGKCCLVVGGGRVAERKIRALLECGAQILCLGDAFTTPITKLAKKGRIKTVLRKLDHAHTFLPYLESVFLVIAATSSPGLNARIYKDCQKRNILINAVDDLKHSNFITPSVLKRGHLSIAISTGGASPAFAKSLRHKLETSLGPEYGAFLDFMARKRKKIMSLVKGEDKRKKVFQELASSRLPNLFKKGNAQAIRKRYESILLKHGVHREALR